MSVIDIVSLMILLGFAVFGAFKGIVKLVFQLLGFVVGVVIAIVYYSSASNFLKNFFENLQNNQAMSNVLGFVIVFLVVYLIFILLSFILSKFLKAVKLKWMDNLGGALIGLILGLLFSSLVINMISYVPMTPEKMTTLKSTYSYRYIKPILFIVKDYAFKQKEISSEVE